MRPRYLLLVLSALVCGCSHTRDLSSTPEYRPWIGQTVKLTSPGDYNIYSQIWGPNLLYAYDDSERPLLGKVSGGASAVIEAVTETKATLLIGGDYTNYHVLLSMQSPSEPAKRIRVKAWLSAVEPFKDVPSGLFDSWNIKMPPVPSPEKVSFRQGD
jgi:hypothetical protein